MSADITRRSFISGAGAATGAMAGAAVLAASGLALADTAGPADEGSADAALGIPDTWDYECDLLVIGYGGAGMWASLIGADECGQKVLVLEKAPVEGGGNSRINNGEWTIVPEDKKETFKEYLVTFSKGAIPAEMAQAWVDEAARNTEYADRYGMTYSIVDVALAGSIPEYYKLDEAKFAGCQHLSSVEGFGMRTFHELDAKRAELGAEVLFGCHGEHLVQDPSTREVLGAWTLIGDDPEPKAVKARKGVVMCCGGFEFNEELKNKYLKIYPFKFEGWRYNTGDGIRMVQEVGANLWHMDNVISMTSMYTRDPENDFSVLVFPCGNSYIWVNRLGKRFVDENNTGSPHNGWHTLMSFSDAICDFDRIPTWCVFDEATFTAGKMGTSQGDFFECGNFASDLPDELRDWDGWSQDNQAEVDKGWIIKADTLDELAAKMKDWDEWMDAETLKDTVAEYNGFCAQGRDERFDREPLTMQAISEKGPYYAYAVYPGSCSTLGGPEKNANGQVLDPAGNPVPRLYAAGCFGNFQDHSYGITGGNNAENMVWGRICARHASGLANWDE